MKNITKIAQILCKLYNYKSILHAVIILYYIKLQMVWGQITLTVIIIMNETPSVNIVLYEMCSLNS